MKISKKGFTLIELMVVIAIIAILAIGGIASYNVYIQKANDSQAIQEIKTVETVATSYYAENSSYPTATDTTGITNALATFSGVEVTHSKTGAGDSEDCNSSTDCEYVYISGNDINGVTLGSFEVSTAFQNAANVTNQAANSNDGGDDAARMEVGTLKDDSAGGDLDSSLSSAGVLGDSNALILDAAAY